MALAFNKSFNVGKVISRLITGVLSLYVGGTILTEFGTTMTNTSSALYTGLGLIGWTVGNQVTNGTAATYFACSNGGVQALADPVTTVTANCITATSGSGVLSVIGILVIAQVIMEFISF